jgi:translation initiation factor 2B subunit (eIF-2B alpha/beta/delta family)
MGFAMKEKDKEILYKLFRDHEDVRGSSRMAMLALRSFIESINDLRCNASEIKELITELCDAIKHTEPRIVPLIHMIKAFETEMEGHYGEDLQETKNEAIRILQEKHDLLRSKVEQVIEHGVNLVEDGDTIVVHTASSDVTNMLVRAKEVLKKNFKLIILKQDFVKTKLLVKTLSKAKIDLLVVPEYSLSHYIEKANKLFIGAVSITPDAKVVAAIGTANIVGLCHINKVPVYLFANSLKFSFHPSSSQRIHTKTVPTFQDDVSYALTTHSHDIVDLKLVDHLVTEDGKIEKPFMEKYVQ